MTNVSVVIPTCGRKSLRLAVESATRQVGLEVEVIVVDASGIGAARELLEPLGAVRYIDTGVPLRPGKARSLGCAHSSGDWVGFLDDDDVFAPTKCGEQLSAATRSNAALVTSDYATIPYEQLCDLAAGGVSGWDRDVEALIASGDRGPRERPAEDQRLASYLFERRSLRSRKRLVTSSILVNGGIARDVSWNESLMRFEDWEWLLRLDRIGVSWVHVAKPLVGIAVNGPESLSCSDLCLDAVHGNWPIALLSDHAPRPLGDLLTCDIGVAFAHMGDVGGAVRMFRLGRVVGKPGWHASARLAVAIAAAQARRGVSRLHSSVTVRS
jgi:glycosyltransferase involved in cell wall biosynthesis